MFIVENQANQVTDKISSSLSNRLNTEVSNVVESVTDSPTKGKKFTNELILDCEQALQQLTLLGYKKEETIYLRGFFPNDDPKGRKSGRNELANNLKQLARKIQELQREGRGAYFVVNGGGQRDLNVKQCRAIFYEHDNLDKALQIELWKSLGLPEPTFQVDSGGKSIHSYWVFKEFISPELWKPLQADLLEFADGDRSIKNPSRVMRLAGGWHLSQKGAFQSQIISSSGQKYSFEELRAIIPPQKSLSTLPLTMPLTIVEVPLERCLRVEERTLISSGIGEGKRNDAGASLARNLIGTATRLRYLGRAFSGNPRGLFDTYGSRCSPPLGFEELDLLWRSAEKDNPTATLPDDALENCIKSWQREQQINSVHKNKSVQKSIVNADNGVLSTASDDNKNGSMNGIESIVNIVNGILGASKNQIEESRLLDQVYLDYSTGQKLERKTFDRIVATERLRICEMESDEKARLKQLLAQSNSLIDWFKVLPASLARDLVKDAAVKNIDPVVVWQPLAAACASLMGVRINLDVESHKIPALLWTATVLETGGGKSRGDQLVLSALRKMQSDENERYAEAIRTYKLNYRDWEKSGKEGDEPTPPTPRKYLFDVATIQAVVKRSADNGTNGSLWARDELAGLFNSLGQFSKDGSDEALQILLKLWDGGAIFVDRVSMTDSFSAQDSALSITGGIQPNVFRRIFEDTEDSNGLQARFLIAVPARQRQKRVKGYCGLSDRLPVLFKWLNELSTTTIKLSPQADDLYSRIIDLSEDYREQTTNTAVRAWLSKWTTQTMRIALILHGLECFYSDRAITSPLQVDTLERALLIAEYYRNQFEFLQEKVSVVDDLTTVMLQIIDRARSCPAGIKLRDTYRLMARTLKPLAVEAGVELVLFTEQLFKRAEEEGYCQVIRSGRTVKLVATIFEKKSSPPVDVDNDDNEAKNTYGKDSNCQHPPLPTPQNSVDNRINHGEKTITELQKKTIKTEEIKVGDHVAPADPKSSCYHWKGKVVKEHPTNPDLCYVRYPERQRELNLKSDTVTSRRSELRKL